MKIAEITAGSKKKIWKSKVKIEVQRLKKQSFLTEGIDLRDLDVIIKSIERKNCPIYLDPQKAGQ